MAQAASIETRVAVIPQPALGPDVFCNSSPITKYEGGAATVFGGLLVGQAIAAANETVPSKFVAHSSQSSFVRAASGEHDINYHVERTSESRSFATRTVRAYEAAGSKQSSAVYVAIISYQSAHTSTNTLDYKSPVPDLDGMKPEDIPKDMLKQVMTASVDKSAPVVQVAIDTPFDWRPCSFEESDDPCQFRMVGFVRSHQLSTDKAGVQMAALGYMSDDYLAGLPMYANPQQCGRSLRKITLALSLNHAVWFHEPLARVDEWMVGQRETYWGANERALVHQKFWSLETGRLIMSGTQEGLYRLKDQMSSKV